MNISRKKVFSILIASILIISVSFGGAVYLKQEEMRKYEVSLMRTYNRIVSNGRLVVLLSDAIAAIWQTSIEYDSITDSVGDLLNEELSQKGFYDRLKYNNDNIERDMRLLKEYPEEFEQEYKSLLDLYMSYSQILEFASNPKGSLLTYTYKSNDLKSDYVRSLSRAKIYLPELKGDKDATPKKGNELLLEGNKAKYFIGKFILELEDYGYTADKMTNYKSSDSNEWISFQNFQTDILNDANTIKQVAYSGESYITFHLTDARVVNYVYDEKENKSETPKLLNLILEVNDALAQSALRALSTAAETYATVNNGRYPHHVNMLVSGNLPYLTKNYCEEGDKGYTYVCNFDTRGYSFIAEPREVGVTGSKKFAIMTGGSFVEVDNIPDLLKSYKNKKQNKESINSNKIDIEKEFWGR